MFLSEITSSQNNNATREHFKLSGTGVPIFSVQFLLRALKHNLILPGGLNFFTGKFFPVLSRLV